MRLTHNRTPDRDPIWSPDGSQIAFISERDLGSDIYLMKQDGTEQTRLTHTGSADSLVWSPGGRQICYRSGNYLWLVDVDIGLERRLTNNTEMEGYPVWSPNGRAIAFLALEEGQFDWWANQVEIRLFELDTEEQKVLGIASPGWTLAWSPDGTHLAFVGPRREYKKGLYSVNVQTLEVTQLVTEDQYIDEGIAWSVDGRQVFYITKEEIYAAETVGDELSLIATVGNVVRFARKRSLVLSPDGHLIALMRTGSWESSKIWVVDIERNLTSRASSGW
jgi:TolB protein